jgi:hypothetical protein
MCWINKPVKKAHLLRCARSPRSNVLRMYVFARPFLARLASETFLTGLCEFLLTLVFALGTACPLASAQTLDQLIASARKEPELTFIAGAGAFGGPKAIADLEAGVNKKFGLNARIRFSAGPEMNAMAARVITELKSGAKASTDIYHGSQSHFSLLHQEKALEQVNWAGVFPWISKPMEIFLTKGCWSLRRCAESFTTRIWFQKRRRQRATRIWWIAVSAQFGRESLPFHPMSLGSSSYR